VGTEQTVGWPRYAHHNNTHAEMSNNRAKVGTLQAEADYGQKLAQRAALSWAGDDQLRGGIVPELVHPSHRRSLQDGKLWIGKVPKSASAADLPKSYLFIHIPKSAGSSFLQDSVSHMPMGAQMRGNGEKAFDNTHPKHGQVLVVFLRNPLKQVLSQFLECKYDDWGKWVTKNTLFPRDMSGVYAGFDAWVAHFLEMRGAVPGGGGAAYSYGCFCPWNMQTRYIGTGYPLSNSGDSRLESPSHFLPSGELIYREPDLELAKAHLDRMYFIGLADLYTESLCLFRYYTTGSLPDGCACGQHEPVSETHISHGVPHHSIDDLSPQLLSDVGKLTRQDVQLFAIALGKFEHQLSVVERAVDREVVCRTKMEAVRTALARAATIANVTVTMASPTQGPSASPTQAPSVSPTQEPSVLPTQGPSASPTQELSASPTQEPSAALTQSESIVSTHNPRPTVAPTLTSKFVTQNGRIYLTNVNYGLSMGLMSTNVRNAFGFSLFVFGAVRLWLATRVGQAPQIQETVVCPSPLHDSQSSL